jgi:SET domain-containing protein
MERCCDVIVQPSRFGKGLFAQNNIKAKTVICNITGVPLSFAETVLLGEKESHSLQVYKDKYVLCDPPFLYSNHSCNPNCAINNKMQLYARKNISVGEELLWDYSTSMLERHWTMQCYCNNKNCRSVVIDFDLLPYDIQEKYLKENIVLPFIVQHMAALQKAHERRA